MVVRDTTQDARCVHDSQIQPPYIPAQKYLCFTTVSGELSWPGCVALKSIAVTLRRQMRTCGTYPCRFADSPYVTPEGGLRFYVGVPLLLASGICIGTL